MTEKEILFAHAIDKINSASENAMVTNTQFLSIDERSELSAVEKKYRAYINTYYYGGYPDAERTVAVFVPDFYDAGEDVVEFLHNNPDFNPITVVKINKDKFSTVSHRDYLGALMGLGIKRELLGDILVFDWGAYLFCLKKIGAYICDNLKQCGKSSVECTTVDSDYIVLPEESSEIRFHSVASMRLDNILSTGFSVPRSLCNEAIGKGLIFVNSLRAEKSDMKIKINDKIVFRGKGKIIISEYIRTNKKDRIHINIKHYK